jgi:PAS domain S-box-containing protein
MPPSESDRTHPAGASRPPDAIMRRRMRQFSASAGGIAVAVGSAGLVGWWAGIPALTVVFEGNAPMVANTALMAVLSGFALLLRVRDPAPKRQRRVAALLAGATALIAGATLLEYVLNVDLGIDLLLAPSQAVLVEPFEGRPTPQAATGFLLLGAALLTLDAGAGRRLRPAEILALAAGAIPTVVLLGYLFGAPQLYDLELRLPHAGFGIHAAVVIILLALGVLALRPTEGLSAILASDGLGGVVARRLLVSLLLLVPVILVVMLGVRGGLYDLPVAAALVVFLSLVQAAAFILLTARRLDRLETAIREAHGKERLQRLWLEAAVDQMPEAVIITDADGRVMVANRLAYELRGDPDQRAPLGEPVPYDVRKPSGEAVPMRERPLYRALELGERIHRAELVFLVEDGRHVPVLANVTPIRMDARIIGAVAVFQDISALKELERMRQEWTAVVAHDLRHPVSTIALSAEALAGEGNGGPSESTRRTVERIRRATGRLSRMIDDLLDASRIESRHLEVDARPGELLGLVRRVVDEVGHTEAAARVRVEGEAVRVLMDPHRIRQVLENLLTNAIKYGWPDAPIDVTVWARGDMAEVTVTNRGPGIPPEALPHLFGRFWRARSDDRRQETGIGLGLYIAHGIVEAHGGRIWAESTPEETTHFRFTLPRAKEARAPVAPPR